MENTRLNSGQSFDTLSFVTPDIGYDTPERIISRHQANKLSLIERNPEVIRSQFNTERESTKDYQGRIIFELLQNALDRADSNIVIILEKDRLQICNDGIPFSIYSDTENGKKSDFHSLCTIYDSDKKPGESVGNKGVGFKSVWNISSKVRIESIREGCPFGFELYAPPKADYFEQENIKDFINAMDGRVPSFYLPVYCPVSEPLIVSLSNGKSLNIVTRITLFLDGENPESEMEQLHHQLAELKKTELCFLNLLERKPNPDLCIYSVIEGFLHEKRQNLEWMVVSLTDRIKEQKYSQFYQKLLKVRTDYAKHYSNLPEQPNAAVAFPPVGANLDQGQVYTYLPTTINFGFNVHVHADFVLDSSRKDIPPSEYNQQLMQICVELFLDTLLEHNRFHQDPAFHQYLIAGETSRIFLKGNVRHSDLIWQRLREKGNLKNLLKKVYAFENHYPKQSYHGIFLALNKALPPRLGGNYDKYHKSLVPLIEDFCDEEIFIVPVGDQLSFLPQPQSSINHLFYRSEKDYQKIQEDLLSGIPNIKISDFEELNNEHFSKNILKPYGTTGLLRALTMVQAENRGESINERIFAVAAHLADSPRRTASQTASFFSTDGQKDERLFSEILVPVIGGGWQMARKVYLNAEYSDWIDPDYFSQLDKDRCNQILTDLNVVLNKSTDAIVGEMGVWRNMLPLKWERGDAGSAYRFSLPWVFVPRSTKLKLIVQSSIGFLLSIAAGPELRRQLLSQPWFSLNDSDEFRRPDQVFLFKERDRRKLNDIHKENRNSEFNELYRYLGIQSISDTVDRDKIISQIRRMQTSAAQVDADHKDIYRTLISAISRITSDEQVDLDLPILYQQHNNWRYGNGADIWFVPADARRLISLLDPGLKVAQIPAESSKKFARSLGLSVLEPEISADFHGGKAYADPVTKRFIQQELMPGFFALAEAKLGTHFDRDETLDRWSQFRILKADWVGLHIIQDGLTVIPGSSLPGTNVYLIPSDEGAKTGFIAHDLNSENLLKDFSFSKFGRLLAEPIFAEPQLAEVFRGLIERMLLAAIADQPETVEEFYLSHGVSVNDISAQARDISRHLVSEKEWKLFIQIISHCLAEPGITIDNWKQKQWYTAEGLRYGMIEREFYDLPRLLSLLEQVSPRQRNKEKIISDFQYFGAIYFLASQRKQELSREEFLSVLQDNCSKLDHFSYQRENYACLFSDVSFTEEEINEAMAEIDHGFASLSDVNVDASPKSQPNPFTPGGGTRVGKVDPDEEERNMRGQQESGSRVEIGVIRDFMRNRDPRRDKDLLESLRIFIDETYPAEGLGEIVSYRETLAEITGRADLQQEDLIYLMHVSKNIGDGLGYDILLPEYGQSSTTILKVEVKSARSKNQRIFFTKNEIRCILRLKDDPHWRIWFNKRFDAEFSNLVKEQIVKHGELYANLGLSNQIYLNADNWYMVVD